MNPSPRRIAPSDTAILLLFLTTVSGLGFAAIAGAFLGFLHFLPSIEPGEAGRNPDGLLGAALASLAVGAAAGLALRVLTARKKTSLADALRRATADPVPFDWGKEWAHFRSWLSRGLRGEGWDLPQNPADLPEAQRDRFRQDLAKTLRDARERALMTQEHLALAAGLSVRTVRRLEANGQGSFESIRSVCSVLGAGVHHEPPEPVRVAWPNLAKSIGFVLLAVTLPVLTAGLLVRSWRWFIAGLGALSALAGLIVWRTHPGDLSGLDAMARSMAENASADMARFLWAFWLSALALYLAGALFRAGGTPRLAGFRTAARTGATILMLVSALPLLQVAAKMTFEITRMAASLEGSTREMDLMRQMAEANPFFDDTKAYALHVLPHMITDGMRLELPDAYRSEEAYERHIALKRAEVLAVDEKLDLPQDDAVALLEQRFRDKHGALLDYVAAQEVSDGKRSFTFRLVGDVLYLLFTDGQGTVLNEPRMQIHAEESPDAALQRATAFVRHVANGSGHAR